MDGMGNSGAAMGLTCTAFLPPKVALNRRRVIFLAPSIPSETINRIQNAANIVDIIGDSVILKKSGRNYLGLCPFHAEKTPSFTVSPEKQMFYCFGCHNGGDIFKFVMQLDGVSFPEAVRSIAGRYGIEVPDHRLSPEQKRQLSEKERLFRVNEIALSFFRSALQDSHAGQRAMTYLLGRGMTRKVIDRHQLGFAPDSWDGLLRFMAQKKVPPAYQQKAGLIVPRKDGSGFYDRFRNRIIFPIFNLSRQIIGFGGRVTDDGMPKYLNSPETRIYNKRRSLYGIEKANRPARSSGIVYLVEGYFDVLAMHLYGIENSVATLGTALTTENAKLLKGMVGAGHVRLVYDSDQAGIKAAQRSIATFEAEALDAKIVVLPKGEDPDSFLRERGPNDFYKTADQAKGMMTFLIDSAIVRHGSSIEGKVKVVSELKSPLLALQDTVARSLHITYLAERLHIDETVLRDKLLSDSVKIVRSRETVQPHMLPASSSDGRRMEQRIVAMMMHFPAMIAEIVGRNLLDYFEDYQLRGIAEQMAQRSHTGKAIAAEIAAGIEDDAYRSLIAKLAIDDQGWSRDGCQRLLAQYEERHRRRQKMELQRQIEVAEKENDMGLLNRLLHKKQKQLDKQ
jgi:DNA primase